MLRNIERKRNQLVFDDVSVDGEDLETDDLDDQLDEDECDSDLDSFINDDEDEPTIIDDETEEEEFAGNLNSSCFYKKKKSKRKVNRLDSDEENSTVQSPKTLRNISLNESSSVLSNIQNTSLNGSSEINTPSEQNSSSDKSANKKNLVSKVSNTIVLDEDDVSKVLSNSKTVVIDESDDEIRIPKSTKTNKTKRFVLDSDSEPSDSEDLFTNENHSIAKTDLNKSTTSHNSKLSDDLSVDKLNEPKFSTDSDSSMDNSNNPTYMYPSASKTTDSELDSDESWLDSKKSNRKTKANLFESDDDSSIEMMSRKTKTNNVFESDDDSFPNLKSKVKKGKVIESDEETANESACLNEEESIECIFTEDDEINQKGLMNKSNELFELDEADLEDLEDTLT